MADNKPVLIQPLNGTPLFAMGPDIVGGGIYVMVESANRVETNDSLVLDLKKNVVPVLMTNPDDSRLVHTFKRVTVGPAAAAGYTKYRLSLDPALVEQGLFMLNGVKCNGIDIHISSRMVLLQSFELTQMMKKAAILAMDARIPARFVDPPVDNANPRKATDPFRYIMEILPHV